MNAAKEWRKRQAAEAALAEVEPLLGPECIVGVGTGSTSNYFIDALGALRSAFRGAVSSSEASTARLQGLGIEVLELSADAIPIYVDGADEVDPERALIKGGGGALTREKVVATAAERFVCIVDDGKQAATLGRFPLPVEVIPMARRQVERRLRAFGGECVHRAGFVTDNGNDIVDVSGLSITEPGALEAAINNIPGVVENGLFAIATRPDVVLIGTDQGVRRLP